VALTNEAECKDSFGRVYYCEYSGDGVTDIGGCYALDARYGEPKGSSCATLVSNCNTGGILYIGVKSSDFTEANGYGKGMKCAEHGGTKVSDSDDDMGSIILSLTTDHDKYGTGLYTVILKDGVKYCAINCDDSDCSLSGAIVGAGSRWMSIGGSGIAVSNGSIIITGTVMFNACYY